MISFLLLIMWSTSKFVRGLALTRKGIYRLQPASLYWRNLHGDKESKIVQFAKRKKNSGDESEPVLRADGNWETVYLGSEDRTLDGDMTDRIAEAQTWTSKQLSDDDLDLLNKSLGIEDEILAALEAEDAELDSKGSQNKNKLKNKKGEKSGKLRNLQALSAEATFEANKIKGFLELNPYICSGCGTPFQSKAADNPGFLPKDKFADHKIRAQTIRNKQEAIKILDMAGIEVDSEAAAEILAEANVTPDVVTGVRVLGKACKLEDMVQISKHDKNADLSYLQAPINDISLDSPNSGLVLDPDSDSSPPEMINDVEVIDAQRLRELKQESLADTVCICQRCFRLQQYGQVEENLRPGWSKNELLTPERFQTLLGSIRETEAVVLCIVDMFDLQGSLLKNLKDIAGSNPIVIAANKVDLLPKDASDVRVTNWVHAEVKYICGLKSPAESKDEARERRLERLERIKEKEIQGQNAYYGSLKKMKQDETGVLRRSNVHLVSCHNGLGIDNLMTNLMMMANDNGNKVYVMGAANVGKSSFINRLVESDYKIKDSRGAKSKPSQKKARDNTPQATVSNLPGTTLDFLKIKLPNGITMIDTPGLLNAGQLTSKLNTAELRQVIPVKPINAVTLRVQEGKCVLLGGLATIELLEGRPFFFTFFVSNEVKLHPTDATKAAAFIERNAGSPLLTPPSTLERVKDIGPFVSHEFNIQGDGWRKSAQDIVIAGLGWVAVTGVGTVKIKVTVPEGASVGLRPPLLPFESSHSTGKFTGGKILKRSKKGGDKTYGWRV